MNKEKQEFDLGKRTQTLATRIIMLFRTQKLEYMDRPLVMQLIRAVTSVGANYCEANEAITSRDFSHKISICKKEIKEVRFWLSLMGLIFPRLQADWSCFEKEATELNLIFAAIIKKTNHNK